MTIGQSMTICYNQLLCKRTPINVTIMQYQVIKKLAFQSYLNVFLTDPKHTL